MIATVIEVAVIWFLIGVLVALAVGRMIHQRDRQRPGGDE